MEQHIPYKNYLLRLIEEDTAEDESLSANMKGFINHADDADTVRPTGFASVEWFGSVEPSNAVDGDTWVNSAG